MRISDWSSDVCSSDLTHHQRIVIRRDGDAVLREHADVIFEVVPDLEHRFVGEKRVEAPDRVGERHLLGLFGEHVDATMAERDVTGAAGRGRHADADERAGDAVEARGPGCDRVQMRGARLPYSAGARLERWYRDLNGRADG